MDTKGGVKTDWDLDDIHARWVEYLTPFQAIIQANVDADKNMFLVDFTNLLLRDKELAEGIVNRTDDAIRFGENALQTLMQSDKKLPMYLRVHKLLPDLKRTIHDFTSADVGKLLYWDDLLVIQAPETQTQLLTGVFTCTSCNWKQEIVQDPFYFTEPLECPKDEGGCSKRAGMTTFKIEMTESRVINVQDLEVQDPPTSSTYRPGRVKLILHDDQCDIAQPGERVKVYGFLKLKQRKSGNARSVLFDHYIDCHHIERMTGDIEEPITVEDMKEVDDIKAKDPLVALVDDIAPHIEGCEDIKLALGLQMFCSSPDTIDGRRIRKDFHVFLIGDPGCAKSALGISAKDLHPHAIYTTSKTSSVAGLTAALVNADSTGDRKALEAGAMVLANGGYMIIDELDKMEKKDMGAFYEALEQQTVSINKAGAKVTLPTQCPVLAIANPSEGRYDPYKSLSAQIKIDPAILSRFGLKFYVQDKVNKERDEKVAEKVVRAHWEPGTVKRKHPPHIWRKYVKLHKDIKVKFNIDEVLTHIKEMYVKMRIDAKAERDKNRDACVPTPRQLEDILRMSEAVARVYGDPVGKIEYVDVAIKLMKNSMNEGDDEIYAQIKTSERGPIASILEIIQESYNDKGVAERVLVEGEAIRRGIDRAEDIINRLIDRGTVMVPRQGWLQVV